MKPEIKKIEEQNIWCVSDGLCSGFGETEEEAYKEYEQVKKEMDSFLTTNRTS